MKLKSEELQQKIHWRSPDRGFHRFWTPIFWILAITAILLWIQVLLFLFKLFFFSFPLAHADSQPDLLRDSFFQTRKSIQNKFAHVVERSGSTLISSHDKKWREGDPISEHFLKNGESVYVGDLMRTGDNSQVLLLTEDGGWVAVRPNTTMQVLSYQALGQYVDGRSVLLERAIPWNARESTMDAENDHRVLSLLNGSLRSAPGWIGKHDSAAEIVVTPSAVLKGTADYETKVIGEDKKETQGTYVRVSKGSLILTPLSSSTMLGIQVTAGSSAKASRLGWGPATIRRTEKDSPPIPGDGIEDQSSSLWGEGDVDVMRTSRIREIKEHHLLTLPHLPP